MYINDTHILYYFFAGLIGLVIGQFIDWTIIRLKEDKKILCREFFTYVKNLKLNCWTMYITAALYVIFVYLNGVSIQTLEYLMLTPILITILVVDFTKHKVPNRILLTLFEVEVVFTAIAGFNDLSIYLDKLLGMLIGAGVFYAITVLGTSAEKKEVMGYGDVKLMAMIGLCFGLTKMGVIAVMSFLMAAIYSIVLLIMKKKKIDSYIPFGPFIVIAAFLMMLLPTVFVGIFTFSFIFNK